MKGGRPTTLPPSVSRQSKINVGACISHNHMGLHGLLLGWLCLTYGQLYLLTVQYITAAVAQSV
jgi:hypothetical protein